MIVAIFVVFLVTLVIGIPLGLGMGLATVAALIVDGDFPLTIVAHKMVNAVNSFPLVAVPLFILAGALAGEGSIAPPAGATRRRAVRAHPRRAWARQRRLVDVLRRHLRLGGRRHAQQSAA